MPHQYRSICRAITEILESRVLLSSATRISDIVAGPESSIAAPAMGTVNGKLLFGAVDPTAGLELFISDGTAAGTTLLKDINPGAASSNVGGFVPGPSGIAYFTANAGGRSQVWRTDGTPGGTIALTNFSSSATPITFVNNRLLIDVLGAIGEDSSLVSSDGATPGNGTTLLTGSMLRLGDVNNVAIFGGENDTAGHPQMFRSNGTSGGSSLLANVQMGLSNESIAFSGELYFQGDANSTGMELYSTNGTAGDTALAADINPGPGASSPHDFTISGVQLYFVANSGAGGEQIYRTNGSTISPVTTLAGTSNSNAIDHLADVNGTVFFSYTAAGHSRCCTSSRATRRPRPSPTPQRFTVCSKTSRSDRRISSPVSAPRTTRFAYTNPTARP